MDSILVISDEPALHETLASELPDLTVVHARFGEAAARVSQQEYRLIVIDEGDEAGAFATVGKTLGIRLTRPIVLRDLLYTIHERLQGKTVPSKEEMALSERFIFLPSERLIRSSDGTIRIPLTEKETELLHYLLENTEHPVARDMLLKRVWGYSDDIATHTLETHIYRLRLKLRQASDALDILSLETGGYQLKL